MEQRANQELVDFILILLFIAGFFIFMIFVVWCFPDIVVEVQNRKAGYTVGDVVINLDLPARRDGELLHWVYCRFYPSFHMRYDDFWDYLECGSGFLFLGVCVSAFLLREHKRELHIQELRSEGRLIRGKYIRHKIVRRKRSQRYIAWIDFEGVVIRTQQHFLVAKDYSDCVAYVNRENPRDYTILVGGHVIE